MGAFYPFVMPYSIIYWEICWPLSSAVVTSSAIRNRHVVNNNEIEDVSSEATNVEFIATDGLAKLNEWMKLGAPKKQPPKPDRSSLRVPTTPENKSHTKEIYIFLCCQSCSISQLSVYPSMVKVDASLMTF